MSHEFMGLASSERYPERRFPDFVIAGAMKSGTTSLHKILSSDPRIYIPDQEIFFFDMDDLFQHPDFAYCDGKCWVKQQYLPEDPRTRRWYASFFAQAAETQWVGEDSTTYVASNEAAERIAAFLPRAKIIVLLRDPAQRTYSHYWHLVRTGRATLSFEDALQFEPGTLIQRSLYKPQVERLRRVFAEDRLLILVFEEFVEKMEESVSRVYRFLGIPDPPGLDSVPTHHNQARVSRWPWLQLRWNRLQRRHIARRRYNSHLLNVPPARSIHPMMRIGDRIHHVLNPARPARPPSMNEATHRMLDEFFAAQNEGLEELVAAELGRYWYSAR